MARNQFTPIAPSVTRPTSSRLFGEHPGGVQVSIHWNNASITQLVRELNGTFSRDIQGHLANAHAIMARAVQTHTVQALKDHVQMTGRQQNGAKYLEEALLSEENIESNPRGFIVNRAEWLDQSPAKLYWRSIEFGHRASKGGKIYFGLWRTAGGFAEPMKGALDIYNAGGFGFVGASGLPGNLPNGMRARKFVISKDFPGYHFMEEGVQRWRRDRANSPLAIYNREFSKNRLLAAAAAPAGKRYSTRFAATFGRNPNPQGQ